MPTQLDTPAAPAVFADATGPEADAVAYWALWYPDEPGRTAAVLATPTVTTEFIEEVLAEVHSTWSTDSAFPVIVAAAGNPNVDMRHAAGWLTGDLPTVPREAAKNPSLFHEAAELRRAGRLGADTARDICANPAATPEYLHRYWMDGQGNAAANPNLPKELLADFTSADVAQAYSNPRISRRQRRQALRAPDSLTRCFAFRNPKTTDRELAAGARAADPSGITTHEAETILTTRRFYANPFDTQVSVVGQLGRKRGWQPRLAATVATLDDTTREAVAALIAARFDGTIAELLDCAHSITAD